MTGIMFKQPYNINPKHRKTACDCVVRAIAYASCQSWEETYEGLCALGKNMYSMPNEKSVYEKYLESLGFEKHKQPKWDDGTKYTVYESYLFVDTKKYDVIISVSNHLTCIDNDRIIDTWNCGNKCVCNYWTRPRRPDAVRPSNTIKTVIFNL